MAKKVDIQEIEGRLWDSADELRANSSLKESEYSVPVLGLIFLKYADSRFSVADASLAGQGSGRRKVGKTDYQAQGVLYLPPAARFQALLDLPEGANIGQAINDAMKAIEDENEELRGVLPRTYNALSNSTLVTLIRNVNSILGDIDGDGFGKVYEYFEPFSGKIFDPACGSGGIVRAERSVRGGAPAPRHGPALDLRAGAGRGERQARSGTTAAIRSGLRGLTTAAISRCRASWGPVVMP